MLWGATRDDHLDTVYSQLKVFIPNDMDNTQVFRVLGVAPSVQNKDFFKSRNHDLASYLAATRDFSKTSYLKQAVLLEAEWHTLKTLFLLKFLTSKFRTH